MEEEERDAIALANYLEGEESAIAPADVATVGLLRHAGDRAAVDPWQRIKAAAAPSGTGSNRLALVAYALAAGLACFVLLRPVAETPLPPEPTLAQRSAAMQALNPDSGPPLQRLGALHEVSAVARQRLVAEVMR